MHYNGWSTIAHLFSFIFAALYDYSSFAQIWSPARTIPHLSSPLLYQHRHQPHLVVSCWFQLSWWKWSFLCRIGPVSCFSTGPDKHLCQCSRETGQYHLQQLLKLQLHQLSSPGILQTQGARECLWQSWGLRKEKAQDEAWWSYGHKAQKLISQVKWHRKTACRAKNQEQTNKSRERHFKSLCYHQAKIVNTWPYPTDNALKVKRKGQFIKFCYYFILHCSSLCLYKLLSTLFKIIEDSNWKGILW